MRFQLIFLALLFVITLALGATVQHKVKNLAQTEAQAKDLNGKHYNPNNCVLTYFIDVILNIAAEINEYVSALSG